ncbi:hypothetical protein FOL47_004025 [Perkinsus chesapeaki]|uniref:Uncharacterized protein n=1 Tax=Perkinsus chesapeaki TaxID=330153 RepID=A0A7J6M5Y0_PERCH|nr:hypothetical protein FOL47_004025 [Perkinsus chesapeaki]
MAVSIPDLEQQIADLEAELAQVASILGASSTDVDQYEDLDRPADFKPGRRSSPVKQHTKHLESLLGQELSPDSSGSTCIDTWWDQSVSLLPPSTRQEPPSINELSDIGPGDLAVLLKMILEGDDGASNLTAEVAEKLNEAALPTIPDLDGPSLAMLLVIAEMNKSTLVTEPRLVSDLMLAVVSQATCLGPFLRPEVIPTLAGAFAGLEEATQSSSTGPTPQRPGTPVSSAPVSPTASGSAVALNTPTSTTSLSVSPSGVSWRAPLSRALLANLDDIEIPLLCQSLYSLIVSPASVPPPNGTVEPVKLPASLRQVLDKVSLVLSSTPMDAKSALLMVCVFASPAVEDSVNAAKMTRKMCEAPDLNSGHLEEIAAATCFHWKFSCAARKRVLPLICDRVEVSGSSPRLVALLAATCAPPREAIPGGRQHPSGDDLFGLVQSASLLSLCAKESAGAMVLVGPTGVPGGSAWVVKDVIDVANYVSSSLEAEDCPDKTSASLFLNHLVDWLGATLVVPTHGIHSAATAPGGVYDQLSRARPLWQIIRAVACLPVVDQPLVTALANMTERAVKSSSARPADTQQLAKHLAKLLIKRAKASGAGPGQNMATAGGASNGLWTILTDRIVRGQGPISVPGAIKALMSLGTTHDSLVSKRPLTKLEKASDVEELAEAIALATDPRSNTCKRLFAEKRALYETDAKAIFAVLSASAVTAAEHGTGSPEATMLLRQHRQRILDLNEEDAPAWKRLLVWLCLLPSDTVALNSLKKSMEEEMGKEKGVAPGVQRVRDVMALLGYSSESITYDYVVDGVVKADIALPQYMTAIVIEPQALFNVHSKRYQRTGWTLLRVKALQQKGWQVIGPVVPESFRSEEASADSKQPGSLVQFLNDQLNDVPYDACITIDGDVDREELSKSVGSMGLGVGVGTKLMPGGQRIKKLVVANCKMPLVAKILLTMLRLGTTVDMIVLKNLGLTDNMTDVLSEFIMTYVLRHPTLSLDLSENHLTDVCANRLLTAVSTGASGARVSLWLGGNCIKEAEKIVTFDSGIVQGGNDILVKMEDNVDGVNGVDLTAETRSVVTLCGDVYTQQQQMVDTFFLSTIEMMFPGMMAPPPKEYIAPKYKAPLRAVGFALSIYLMIRFGDELEMPENPRQ